MDDVVWVTKPVKPHFEDWGCFKRDKRGRLFPICPICGVRINFGVLKGVESRKRKPREHQCKLPLIDSVLDDLASGLSVTIKTITGFEFEVSVVNIPQTYTDFSKVRGFDRKGDKKMGGE